MGLQKKPILKVSFELPFDGANVGQINDDLSCFKTEIMQLNTSKTGDLKLTIRNDKDGETWPNVSSIYYHLMVLESPLGRKVIRRLELQVDFMCTKCRSFLAKMDDLTMFSRLEHFKVNCVNHRLMHTVGLYVHILKSIFRLPFLVSLEVSDIPETIMEELKVWFSPGNVYFAQIRNFSFVCSQENSLIFSFDKSLLLSSSEN